jgi:hypothetical protein
MVSGLIIMACIGVGVLIWNSSWVIHRILKEEIMKNPLNTLGQVYRRCSCAGIIRNVINGSCFLLKDFRYISGSW